MKSNTAAGAEEFSYICLGRYQLSRHFTFREMMLACFDLQKCNPAKSQ
jgi:hypothetical protein